MRSDADFTTLPVSVPASFCRFAFAIITFDIDGREILRTALFPRRGAPSRVDQR
jgi:hypothetical protein